MKKLICALMCAVMLLGLAPSVFALKNGDVVDAVLHTDIVTYINGTPIESYNIKGYTAVKVEDLMNYGFMVVWDAGARTLKVTRPVVRPVTSTYVPVANTYIVGSYWMDVYYTDIKTYFNGNEVPSYNIGGSTIAYVDDLAKYFTTPDKYIWDGSARTLSLTLPGETSGSGSGSSTAQPTPATTPAAPLKITSQPVSVTAKANDTVKFSVAVSGGEGTITYKWERRAPTETTWTAAGGTGADYSFTATQDVLSKNYIYRCVITDSKGNSVTSAEASLTAVVIAPLSIVIHPQSQTADTLLGTLSFTVAAQGGTPGAGGYLYLWQTSKDGVNWSPASGVSNGQIYNLAQSPDVISSVTYIRCVVTDSTGASVASNPAVVTGIGASSGQLSVDITSSVSGNKLTFTANVTGGVAPYTYQWKTSDGYDLTGETSKTHVIDMGNMTAVTWARICRVTDSTGQSVLSDTAEYTRLAQLTATLNYSGTVKLQSGGSISLKVTVKGGNWPYTLEWQFYNKDYVPSLIGGSGWQANTWYKVFSDASKNTDTLTRDSAGTYRCKVTDYDGTVVYSNEVTIEEEAAPLSASLNYNGSVKTGGNDITLTVTASGGKAPYTYEWQFYNAVAIWGWKADTWYKCFSDGRSIASYTTGKNASEDGSLYRCKVTDADGNSVYSNMVKLIP